MFGFPISKEKPKWFLIQIGKLEQFQQVNSTLSGFTF